MRMAVHTRLVFILLLAAVAAAFNANGDVIELNADNFDQMVSNGEPWVVEFMAPWCGHCKSLKPHYQAAAKKCKGKSNFGVVNAEKYRSLAMRFSINGFPTLYHVVNGTEVRRAQVSHNTEDLAHFATKGWKTVKVPFTEWSSPMGLWGKAKFYMIYHIEKAASLHEPLAEKLGLPPAIVLFMFMLVFVMSLTGGLIGCAVWLGPKKPRNKRD